MGRIRWRDFGEAREYVRAIGLLDQAEWCSYARGDLARRFGRRPADIPSCPARGYRELGWNGMRDWLGPAPLAPAEPGYLDFRRARTFARSLGFTAPGQWHDWRRGEVPGARLRPRNVPEDPARMYPRAWRGWADWLGAPEGVPRRSSRFRLFADARAFVRALGLANVREWRAFCAENRPPDIPANPDNAYRHHGWTGYGDWLGTGAGSLRQMPYMPFEDARAFARRLGLSSGDEFRVWTRGDRSDLPPVPRGFRTNPHRAYRDLGWTTWGDFLGTGNVHKKDFPPFERVREIARSVGLSSHLQWWAFCRGEMATPPPAGTDLPRSPDVAYRGRGWTSWGDFLGTGNATPGREFRSFAAAREFARSLRLNSVEEWREYVRGEFAGLPPLPDDVPAGVESYYSDAGWGGWPDFLGNPGRRHARRRRPFAEARELARSVGLKRATDWTDWLHDQRPDLPAPPDDLPRAPALTYHDEGWQGWGDFLGTGAIATYRRTWRSFGEARAFARTLGLHTRAQWNRWGRGSPTDGPRPADIPAKPDRSYADQGWNGWRDFLRP